MAFSPVGGSALKQRAKTILGIPVGEPVNRPSAPAPTPSGPVDPGKPLSQEEWFQKNYKNYYPGADGVQPWEIPGLYKEYTEGFGKKIDKYNLETNYGTAMGALEPAASADIAEYQRLSPFAQRKLLGGLNARGLGSSVAAGGAGSGMVDELTNRQSQGLYDIKSGYQDLSNNLERQKAGDVIDLDSFYRNLASQRERARIARQQQQFGFEDVLGLGASLVGLA